MDIMLASFGLAQDIYWKSKGKKSPLQESFFYDIPPFFPSSHHFGVNIVPFILYDKVIINKTWFGRTRGAKDALLLNPIFDSENLRELIRRGIVEVHDYGADTSKHLDILEKMTEHDLVDLALWQEIVDTSSSMWLDYAYKTRKKLQEIEKLLQPPNTSYLRNILAHSGSIQPLDSVASHGLLLSSSYFMNHSGYINHDLLKKELLSRLREAIQGYLLSINNTFLLSKKYSAGICDWFDCEPFYSAKITWSVVGSTSTIPTISQAGTIIDYYLPISKVNSIAELLEARDKAKGLRQYLDAKQNGDKGADEISLLKILDEIKQTQKKIERFQKIASYFTIPLSLIPIPVVGSLMEKAVGDVIDWGIEKKLLEKYKWHFSLLDFANNKPYQNTLPDAIQRNILLEKIENMAEFCQCEALTKAGRRCKNVSEKGSKFCKVHNR